MTSTYILTGTVHPTRANLSVSGLHMVLHHVDSGISGNFSMTIQHNHVTVKFDSSQKLADLATSKNIIEDAASLIVDMLALDTIRGYELELYQVHDLASSEPTMYGVDRPGISAADGAPFNMEIINLMDQVGRNGLYRIAVSDFRQAITRVRDTGFLCYRALEALIQHYKGIIRAY